ncbi:MAG: hypothetical protein AAFP15_02085 [Bacteroidota bacterium]
MTDFLSHYPPTRAATRMARYSETLGRFLGDEVEVFASFEHHGHTFHVVPALIDQPGWCSVVEQESGHAICTCIGVDESIIEAQLRLMDKSTDEVSAAIAAACHTMTSQP